MSKPVKPLSLIEVKNEITSALRRTALRPTLYGYKPQPIQLSFHKSQARGKLAIGGNRSGKTVTGGAEMVMRMTGKHEWNKKFHPPVRCRAIGVDFDNGVNKIIMPEIARWMPSSELINGSWEDSYSKGDRTLTLANGSTLEFMSYDQDVDKFSGTSRHCVWFDEEPPEEIFNENLARLIDVGGDYWVTMTPLIDMSWTLDRLYNPGMTGTNPDIEVFEMPTSENVYVNSAEIDILTMGMSDDQRDARLTGHYMTYSGTIYSDAIQQKTDDLPGTYIDSIIDSDVWEFYYNNWGHFGMLDHGLRAPTAFLLAAFDQEGRIVVYDEYYQPGRLVPENAREIKNQIAKLRLTNKIEYMVADPSIRNRDPIAGSSVQAAYAEAGMYFSLANNDVIAGINRVAYRFKTRQLYITRNCVNLIHELGRYRWDKFLNSKVANRNNLKETPLKKDDHACDALRYGVVSRPSLPGEKDMRIGNIIGAPVAIENDIYRDVDLIKHWGSSQESLVSVHPILGSDY